jgi:hypothetical protein
MITRRIAAALGTCLFWATISNQAEAAPFQVGDFVTLSQDSWGETGEPGYQLLFSHFDTLYPNGVEIGISGAAGFSAKFQSPDDVAAFLPASGPAGPLSNDFLNPDSLPDAGAFGGFVMALAFNVNFSDAGILTGTAGLPLGDLIIDGTALTAFNGMTVRRYLSEVNDVLGGRPLADDLYDPVANLTQNLTRAFEGGVPNQFAHDHLRIAAQPVPEPATLSLLGIGVAAAYRLKKR